MENTINKILEELEDRYREDKKYLPYIEAQNTILHYGPKIFKAGGGWKKVPDHYPIPGEKVILVSPAQEVMVGAWDGKEWATLGGEKIEPTYWTYGPWKI